MKSTKKKEGDGVLTENAMPHTMTTKEDLKVEQKAKPTKSCREKSSKLEQTDQLQN